MGWFSSNHQRLEAREHSSRLPGPSPLACSYCLRGCKLTAVGAVVPTAIACPPGTRVAAARSERSTPEEAAGGLHLAAPRAAEGAVAGLSAQLGGVPICWSCGGAQARGLAPLPQLRVPLARGPARLEARPYGRGTGGATMPGECASGLGRLRRSRGRSGGRLAARALGSTAIPREWFASLLVVCVLRNHSHRTRRPRRAPATPCGRP